MKKLKFCSYLFCRFPQRKLNWKRKLWLKSLGNLGLVFAKPSNNRVFWVWLLYILNSAWVLHAPNACQNMLFHIFCIKNKKRKNKQWYHCSEWQRKVNDWITIYWKCFFKGTIYWNSMFLVILVDFLLFSTKRKHVQAWVCWSKYTTATINFWDFLSKI